MMFAWDLDNDTHSYFRKYLDTFINKRKISECILNYVINTRTRAITSYIRPGIDTDSIFNELRISLPNRITRVRHSRTSSGVIVEYINSNKAQSINGSLDCTPFQGGRKQTGAEWGYLGGYGWTAPIPIDNLHPIKKYI